MIDEILLSDEDFTIHLFCIVDDKMKNVPKHNQANLYPNGVVALALLFALKGRGNRAFYRWVFNSTLTISGGVTDRIHQTIENRGRN